MQREEVREMADRQVPGPSFEDLVERVHRALQLWHKDATQGSPLEGLGLLRAAWDEGALNVRQASNRVLAGGLAELERRHPQEAALLKERFVEGQMVFAVANRHHVSEASIYRQQARAITLLAGVLTATEGEARGRRRAQLLARLGPPGYTLLVGVDTHLEVLTTLLRHDGPPYLVLVEGIGGIGKTSLCDALARRCVEQGIVEEIGWVSARLRQLILDGSIRPEGRPTLSAQRLIETLAAQILPELPALADYRDAMRILHSHVSKIPTLVVIDNLETVQDVVTLLPILRQLSGPARFLLTSRRSLYEEQDVYHYPLPELREVDALQLVRHEGCMRNLPYLAGAEDEELRPIYDTVGGNPLALRLVVGQIHVHSLDRALEDLTAARGGTAETLYEYVYRRAWESLDEPSRRLLLAMPLVDEPGGSLEFVQHVSGLDDDTLGQALNQLVKQNLVDSRGGLHERRYTIHSLTRTFLLQQVARWQ
jgi:hypothetical protein